MADTNLLILAREFKTLRNHVQEVLKMPVGPQGLQGEKGEQGVKGDTGAPGKNGKDGKDGVNGVNGSNGIDGKDGEDGKDGLDGVGVQNAYIDFDNSLVIVLTSGQEINAGFLSQETKDAVVATFKQGAQTLNELLPVQTGNANKFLKTDGENVSWDTLDGSDIDLASPPVIGNTTPNAATFTTLTTTGISVQSSSANNGLTMVRNTDSSVNSTRLFMDSSGGTSAIYNSSGSILFNTSAAVGTTSGNNQFRVSPTASAVNYVQVTGAATGGSPVVSAQGSDANVGLAINSKGTGSLLFQTNGTTRASINSGATFSAGILASGNPAFVAAAVASQVNYLQANGAATGSAPVFSVAGSDTNIGLNLTSKGTGELSLSTGSTNPLSLVVQDDVTAAPTPTSIYVINASSGLGRAAIRSSKALYLASASTNAIAFLTNSSKTAEGSAQFQVTNTTSAVNYVQVTGSATGGQPNITAQGSDAAIGMTYRTKGNFNHQFQNGSFGIGFEVAPVASTANYLRSTSAATTSAPILSAQGTDTNIDLALTPKGTGNVRFGTRTASADAAITGYIEIKDSGGTIRRLAVIG